MNIITKKDYRLVVLSDMHCGHCVGLTPPQFQGKFINEDVVKHNKYVKIQKSMWDFFSKEITTLNKEKRIDILVSNGDAINGQNTKNSGVEEITTDRLKQVAIAKSVIDFVDSKSNIIVSGTDFHVGNSENFEQILAEQLDCKFENHTWLDISKQVFDIKHHCASSGVPQGRYNPIAKEAVWASLWSETNLIPNPVKFLVRSHVHYFSLIQNSRMTALTTPALQGFGSRYGATRCSGLVDIGFISFDILKNGQTIMTKHFANMLEQKTKPIIFQ